MKPLLEKIFTAPAQQAVESILSVYQQQKFAVVNFVYFANIVAQKLFKDNKYKTEK